MRGEMQHQHRIPSYGRLKQRAVGDITNWSNTVAERRRLAGVLVSLFVGAIAGGLLLDHVDCTPKMRHEVKGRPTLNGEVYGCGPENLQPRSEDRGDAGN